ncbi:hypothetical protein BOX15_Mlig001702g1 [Macrostomum lignano]|uniref:Methyltransferase domain-containing protein n=1 Tax=Macrostomum lignano TaxID=282301 RepID=A0A267FSJ7_9PLAT|nr:hypothetical protein BOX15_Mlig001702g1 [Macrostomum lignano]
MLPHKIGPAKKPLAWLNKPSALLFLVCSAAASLLLFCSIDSEIRTSPFLCSRQSNASMPTAPTVSVESAPATASESNYAVPTVHRYDNGIIRLRSNRQRHYPRGNQLATLNVSELESLYENVLLELTAECSTNRRLGRTDDGGWNLCLTGPFGPKQPCYSFSFGINNIWEFDDQVAKLFKCRVITFDPSMNKESFVRSEQIVFLNEGLHAAKGTLHSWPVDSYLGFLRRFKAEDRVIDILKIDIEHSEWPALKTAVKDGSLKNVKQLLLETHIKRKATANDYLEYFAVLESLHSLGFRLWHYNWNTFGNFISRHDATLRTCCHELYYINSNFLTTDANLSAARNPSDSANVDLRTLLPISKTGNFNRLESLRRVNLGNQTERQVEDMYFAFVEQQQIACPFSRRVGDSGDGGWDVCFTAPFDISRSDPCVAFSFGINNIWKFDDQLAEKYRCKVYMFDPSMTGTSDHQRKQTSWFYRTGLGAENKVDSSSGWKMRTLCHLLDELGYVNRPIDIVKIDIEHWEWSSLERAIQEGCLHQVKQLLFESHTGEMVQVSTDYTRLVRVWLGLFNIGFRSWKWHKNPTSIIYRSRTGAERACCYEHYMLNTKLIKL